MEPGPLVAARPVRAFGNDVLLTFVLYLVLAYLAILIARQPGSIAAIWPANGVATALIASAPRGRRWALLAAAAAGNLLANLAYGDPPGLAIAFVPPNALEVLVAAYLVRRTGLAERFVDGPQPYLRVLLAGALLPALLGATAGAATLQVLGFARFTAVWLDWYFGAALGSAAMLPLVLALRSTTLRASLARMLDPMTAASLLSVVALTFLALRYLPYPFVFVSVLLTGVAFARPRLATLASGACLVAALSTALATGWYVPEVAGSVEGHVLIFVAAMLVLVSSQVVSVVVTRQRALSEMLAAVGSRVDDVIVFFDRQGVYRWVNRARDAYWGAPRDAVLGRHWADGPGTEAHDAAVRPLFERAQAGEVVRRMVDVDYPVRGLRTIDMTMQPARDEEGRQIGVLYCGSDVTELEAARRELQRVADQLLEANRNLEQFVRISSHDLREPLNTIVQFCDLIEVDKAGHLDDAGRLYFSQVRGGAARMKRMLDDVLQFIRLEDTGAVEAEAVDLDRLVHDVIASLAAQVRATGGRIETALLGTVRTHPALVALLVQNLLSNAMKYVAPGVVPFARVFATREGGELRLSVQDNGIGIEPKHLEELGTPFRRLHSRRKYEGTGLGLAICKRIAHQLEGRLEIESTPGAGSCFSVVLADDDPAQ